MRLSEVAEVFGHLEGITARRTLVEEVARLLRRAGSTERAALVYLLQGRLGPPFEGLELGLGEKLLGSAIAIAGRATDATVARRFRQLGDLGLVAEALVARPEGRALTLRQGYQTLLDIAHLSGAGSVRRKTERFSGLLRRSGPLAARLLVRTAQGRLRLGVGDQTILEAAALGALGERSQKALLEAAYNVRSDLGRVVRLAFERRGRGLAGITPEIGVPVRPALAQRLPSAKAVIARLGAVQAEPKYDGFRLQLHRNGRRVWVFSRRLENVTGMFPELAQAACRQFRAKRVILEGEAVVHNPETGEFLPFQVTMSRKRKRGIAEAVERYPLRLFAFDLLYTGRRSCLDQPQRLRSRQLQDLVRSGADDPIAVTETRRTRRADELEEYFEEMVHRGLEGIVAKRPDAPYRAGPRGFDWVKLKRAYQSRLRDTVDVVLVGYLRGRGKRAALGIGSLLAAVYDSRADRFRTVAKIGSGLSEKGWRDLRIRLDRQASRGRPSRVDSLIVPDVWVEPTIVIEVLADEITRSPAHTCGRRGDQPGYALRFPRMLRERPDRAPSDATSEREIRESFRRQRARGSRPVRR